MFEKYFVTCNVAKALREVGYNEPCLAVWEYYEFEDNRSEHLYIGFYSHEIPDNIYNEQIRALMNSRPGMFEKKRTNQTLQPWLYAAPMYQQVFDWLMTHNIHVHDCYIAKKVNMQGTEAVWYVNLIDTITQDSYWPSLNFKSILMIDGNQKWTIESQIYYETDREAWEAAILQAIEILKTRQNINHGKKEGGT
jgi:hypothetical protein